METLFAIDPLSFSIAAAIGLAAGCLLPGLRPGFVVDRPALVLLGFGLVSCAALVGLVRVSPPGFRVTVDPSTEPLLPRGDPAQELYRAAIRDFGDDEIFVVAMETSDVFTKDALAALRAVNDRVARLPGVRNVQSLVDVISFRYEAEADWIDVSRFIDEIPEEAASLRDLRQRALADPLYQQTLVSPDGATAAINVTFRKMTDREFIESGIDAGIRRIVEEESLPGTRFYIAGRPHVKARVYSLMIRDLRLLIPAALVVMAVGLRLALGTRRGVVLPLGTVLLANLWTFSAMAVCGRPLTILTGLLGPMLIAIGSVYGVHVVARYEEFAGDAPDARTAALDCLTHMRTPVLIAGLTTMIGFAALLLSDVPAVFELGAFAVFGVGSTTVITLTGLHAALALLPLRPARTAGFHVALDARLAAFGRSIGRHSTAWLVGWAAITAVAVAAIPRIVIDTDYLSFFHEDSDVRLDFEAVNRLLAGAVPLYVTIDGGEAGALREPDLLRWIEGVQEKIEGVPLVSRTLSLADTVRVMNRSMARDDPEEERIPDDRGSVAELIFLTPKGHLDRYTNVNHSRGNVLVRTGAVGTASVRQVTGTIQGILDEVPPPNGARVGLTGNTLLLSRSADGIARGQPRTVGLAVAAILVLVAFGLRSFPTGVVAMIPNVVPVLVFFGLLGLGVAPLSLPTSLIGSVALGIAVDDTVHYLVRYRKERAAGASPEEASVRATRRVGRPIVITSVMLCLGFLVIGLSDFASLVEFGLLSAATMGICLATDLILLPALLVRTGN